MPYIVDRDLFRALQLVLIHSYGPNFFAYISSEKSNTHTVHADMNASTAFKYDTGGKEACDLACWVERVSREVTPRVTRAGAASGLIQNDTHCNQVMILQVNILLIQYL